MKIISEIRFRQDFAGTDKCLPVRGMVIQKNSRNTEHILLDKLFHPGYIPSMVWDVEYTDDFGEWWNTLTEEEQEADRLFTEHLKILKKEDKNYD